VSKSWIGCVSPSGDYLVSIQPSLRLPKLGGFDGAAGAAQRTAFSITRARCGCITWETSRDGRKWNNLAHGRVRVHPLRGNFAAAGSC
jgi:hypothetical protein